MTRETQCPLCNGPLSQGFAERWKLEEKLGAGSMGTVWLATERALARPVAIKFLKSAGSDTAYTRFVREGQLMARLNHPNVVRVLDCGSEHGHPYLVFTYVDGCALEKLIDPAEPMAYDVIRRIGVDLLEGVIHCHQAGVVHRDLKPANILIDETGRALISDFGVSALSDFPGENITEAGALVGTPGYMAPEQSRSSHVGPQADAYGVGLILYEMIAGRRPFQGKGVVQMLELHRAAPPPPLEHLRPMAPGWLTTLVHELLAKNPAERPTPPEALARLKAAEVPDSGTSLVPAVLLLSRSMTLAPRARPRTPPRAAAGLALASLALLGAIDLALVHHRSRAVAPAPSRSAAAAPRGWDAALEELGREVAETPVELVPFASGHTKGEGDAPLVIADAAGSATVHAYFAASDAAEVVLPSGRTLTRAAPDLAFRETGLENGLNWLRVRGARPEAPPELTVQRRQPWPAPNAGPAPVDEVEPRERLYAVASHLKEIGPTELPALRETAMHTYGNDPALTGAARELLEMWRVMREVRWDVFYVLGPQEPAQARRGWLAFPGPLPPQVRRTVDALDAALAAHPARWDLWHELGGALIAIGHPAPARTALFRALLRHPASAITWRLVASDLRETAQYAGKGALPPEQRARRRVQAAKLYQLAIALDAHEPASEFRRQMLREAAELDPR